MENQIKEVESAKIVTLIHITISRGDGSTKEPFRYVEQYWTLDGIMAAEYDSTRISRAEEAQRVELAEAERAKSVEVVERAIREGILSAIEQ